MNSISKYIAIALTLFIIFSFTGSEVEKQYKCMIQMKNYDGEGAYIVISLLNAEGKYEKTLYVHGDDKEWYHELSSWWKFYGRRKPNIDGITGATVKGGRSAISVLKINPSWLDKGYKLRFESAVEEENYFVKDLEFPLTEANLRKKLKGKGFIQQVRMLPQGGN